MSTAFFNKIQALSRPKKILTLLNLQITAELVQ